MLGSRPPRGSGRGRDGGGDVGGRSRRSAEASPRPRPVRADGGATADRPEPKAGAPAADRARVVHRVAAADRARAEPPACRRGSSAPPSQSRRGRPRREPVEPEPATGARSRQAGARPPVGAPAAAAHPAWRRHARERVAHGHHLRGARRRPGRVLGAAGAPAHRPGGTPARDRKARERADRGLRQAPVQRCGVGLRDRLSGRVGVPDRQGERARELEHRGRPQPLLGAAVSCGKLLPAPDHARPRSRPTSTASCGARPPARAPSASRSRITRCAGPASGRRRRRSACEVVRVQPWIPWNLQPGGRLCAHLPGARQEGPGRPAHDRRRPVATARGFWGRPPASGLPLPTAALRSQVWAPLTPPRRNHNRPTQLRRFRAVWAAPFTENFGNAHRLLCQRRPRPKLFARGAAARSRRRSATWPPWPAPVPAACAAARSAARPTSGLPA